jgi:ATP-dependent Lhr-like helicase
LARIHRLTLGRMRKEIEAVAPVEFMKFLCSWQHLAPGAQLRGRDGVLQVIEQLQGLELPAPAWEQQVLPARIENYDPADLEHLCLSGMVAWGRLRPANVAAENGGAGRRQQASEAGRRKQKRLLAPARNAPIAFLLRDQLSEYLAPFKLRYEQLPTLSPMAREVALYLESYGASFLNDIARATGLLNVKVEEALWQLVAHGLATGDGIAGLRVLLTPEPKRLERRRSLRVISGGKSPARAMPVGRWSLWRQQVDAQEKSDEGHVEHQARQLLRRYGVVFRELLAREQGAGSWRGLLAVYRRLEARGEIRGGRFVNGFVGEQFALPEAVDHLRSLRSKHQTSAPLLIAAADPLNFAGILSPGTRVSPYSNLVLAYRDGALVDTGLLGELVSRLQESRANLHN